MKIRLMNMVRIVDKKTNEVVVLDKKKVYGWEGLTFPGGKVEPKESITDSVIREAKEETNLDIKNPKYIGMITWFYKQNQQECKDIGFLYETYEFSGKLEKDNREGKLFWKDYEEFKKMDGMSDSMEDILYIYDKNFSEIFWDLEKNEKYFYK